MSEVQEQGLPAGEEHGERGLVRISLSAKGERQWAVSVRTGETRAELLAAVAIALEVEQAVKAPAK